MKISSKFSLALLAGTILSTPAIAAAATLTPTLDTIKAEAANISGSYELMEPVIPPALADLPEDTIIAAIKLIANNRDYLNRVPDEYREAFASILPEDAILVEIDNKMYYFTSSDNDAERFRTLAGTVAGNLTEDENGIFELNGTKYSFNTEAIPASVFEYTEGTAEDYNFTMQEANAEGNLTTKYYKVVLKPEKFTTKENIKWEFLGTDYYSPEYKDNNLADDNQIKGYMYIGIGGMQQYESYGYIYTKPDGYKIKTGTPLHFDINSPSETNAYRFGGAALNNPAGNKIGDIKDTVFANNQVTGKISGNSVKDLRVYGGAIYNAGIIGDINADFVNNFVTVNTYAIYIHGFGYGGAIYNDENAIIGDINGDFIGHFPSYAGNLLGGAIYNRGSIGDITGNFIDNYQAINNSGHVGDVTGNFIGNEDAIVNQAGGSLGYITGNFFENASLKGGVIDNKGTITGITGSFIKNFGREGGGVIDNKGTIGTIIGDFIGNYSVIYNSYSGGAITGGNVNNIVGNFINNSAGIGGALGGISIKDITGDFIGNHALAGGAIANSYFGVTGDFIGNYAQNEYNSAYGGAIAQGGFTVTGDFIGNYAQSEGGNAYGGAIYNGSTIGAITGDFIGNYAQSDRGNAFGGAIYTVPQVTSLNMSDNLLFHLNVKYNDQEMEIYMPMGSLDGNMQMVTGTITVGSEEEFSAYKPEAAYTQLLKLDPANITAADYVELMIQKGTIPEDQRDEALAKFEALSPEEQEKTLDNIRQMAELVQNAVNNATPLSSSFGKVNFYNSSFRNNYVKSENGEAKGGAIYGNGINITADNYTSIIDGNKANDENNAFYVLNSKELLSYIVKALQDGLQDILPGGNLSLDAEINIPDLTLNTVNNGVILLNDGIDGVSGYSLAFNGDKGVDEAGTAGGLSLFNSAGDGRTTQYVKLNNSIANAGNIDIVNTTLSFGKGPYGKGEITADGAPVTKVSLQNAAFDLYNKYQEKVTLKGWSANNGYLHVDVDVDNLTADMLNINGNVEGQTKLVLYPNSDKDITGKSIVFAQSSNDTTGTTDSFTVYRVYRSPYMFKVGMTGAGTTEHEWYLTMTDEKNEFAGVEPGEQPDPEVPDVDIPDIDIPDINIPTAPSKVYAEVVAYGALPAAALEQTRNMVDNIGNQIKNSRVYTRSCSFVDGYWNGEPYYNLWVNPTYYTSNIDSPFAIDADIWGIEAGGDIQRDINNRLGIFVSYRQGEYDMDGNGDRYYSTVGSEIDIDSYIAGLYYRYDHNNWYAFATLYGGIQEADIKTDDGMKSDTDGVEFGASAEVGYDYALTDSVTLTPELGVFYTQVNYDDATDNMGKRASYDDARQIELEAGVKLAKTFMTDESFANVYVKPSVVQTIVDGDEVNITGLGDVEALDDATLGRIEIGGRYGFTTNLSAYGWANYTFGSDYDATTFGLGLNYAF